MCSICTSGTSARNLPLCGRSNKINDLFCLAIFRATSRATKSASYTAPVTSPFASGRRDRRRPENDFTATSWLAARNGLIINARAFETSRRREVLSFKHHAEV
jgi:hypothetical protein